MRLRWLILTVLWGCEGPASAVPAVEDAAVDAAVGADASVDAAPPMPDAALPGAALADALPEDALVPDALPPDAAPVELRSIPGPTRYVPVGEPVELDGSASTGAVAYQWSFGDGTGWDSPRPEARATVTFARPGRYRAVLTVFDETGRRHAAEAVLGATWAPVFEPRASGTVALLPPDPADPDAERGVIVVPDAAQVVVFERRGDALRVLERLETGHEPRTVALTPAGFAVVSRGADAVDLFPGGRVALPAGSRPFGAVSTPEGLFVTLQGPGALAQVSPAADGGHAVALHPGFPDARAIAALPDGRLVVSRWRSPDGALGRGDPGRAELRVFDPRAPGPPEVWPLAFDPQASSDTEIGGLPSYLAEIRVAPHGRELAVPSLQANTSGGLFFDGRPLDHQTTVRAVVSFLDPATGEERPGARKQYDNRGYASAAAYSARGDYLFVAMRGSRTVERLDQLAHNPSGTLVDVGLAPEGLALSRDDRWLYVDATLDRELVLFDVSSFRDLPRAVARLPLVEREPLAPEVLRGKQLFNDAFDPRLAADGYIACAHCHLDGESDLRTWDFTQRGEGLRNTVSLLGRAGTAHGPLHWSANFDEVQDFEHDLREAFGGTGLLDDAVFHAGGHDTPLGTAKAGLGADLDALAAYVTSLDTFPASPHREGDGALDPAAARGRALFEGEATGCTACHVGPALTDSGFDPDGAPRLHDVGTLTPASGQRLGGELTGLDTPTLHDLWESAPYLHDGRAATLRDVLVTFNPEDRHGRTSHLTPAELVDLEAWLLSRDARPD